MKGTSNNWSNESFGLLLHPQKILYKTCFSVQFPAASHRAQAATLCVSPSKSLCEDCLWCDLASTF